MSDAAWAAVRALAHSRARLALEQMHEREGMTQQQLADELPASQAAVSRLLTRLAAAGLVEPTRPASTRPGRPPLRWRTSTRFEHVLAELDPT